MKKPIRFFFSFRSPYSWIAFRELDARLGFDPGRIQYIPFWEPDPQSKRLLGERGGAFLYAPMSREKHLYILQDIKRLVRKYGLKMAWPVDKEPWWELSHLGFFVAERAGKAREYLHAVYRARWEEGADISQPDTLLRVAGALGLDGRKILSAPMDEAIRDEGAEALNACVRDGVFGVPFFVHGYQKFWGLDRLEDFLATLADAPAFPGRDPAPNRQAAAAVSTFSREA
ncbi:MAG TPA: DsbA family protein [Fibrobacteria bacterium]|nr:DsbA family protein [Fibrobacteria bacterium]